MEEKKQDVIQKDGARQDRAAQQEESTQACTQQEMQPPHQMENAGHQHQAERSQRRHEESAHRHHQTGSDHHHQHHHHHHRHMSQRNRRILMLAGGAALLLVLLFFTVTLRLYQKRQESDALIASRRAEDGIFGAASLGNAERAGEEGNALRGGTDGDENDESTDKGADGVGGAADGEKYGNISEKDTKTNKINKTDSKKDTNSAQTPLLKENHVEYNGKKYIRNTYLKAYLFIGIDRKDKLTEQTVTGQAGQADGVFLAIHDTANNTAKIVQIPRDTMTPITLTDLSGNVLGQDTQAVSLSFAYGDGREKSCEYTQKAVSDLLWGLPIDGYFAASTNVISILNDLLGGVDVTIETDGLEKANPAFVKGATVHLAGDMAERFVRYRDTEQAGSPLVRMSRQRQYLIAFEQKLQEASKQNDALIPQMFDAIADYMLTDMDKGTYLKLGLDLAGSQGLSENDFYQIPGEAGETAFYDEFYPDKQGILELMLELFYREDD